MSANESDGQQNSSPPSSNSSGASQREEIPRDSQEGSGNPLTSSSLLPNGLAYWSQTQRAHIHVTPEYQREFAAAMERYQEEQRRTLGISELLDVTYAMQRQREVTATEVRAMTQERRRMEEAPVIRPWNGQAMIQGQVAHVHWFDEAMDITIPPGVVWTGTMDQLPQLGPLFTEEEATMIARGVERKRMGVGEDTSTEDGASWDFFTVPGGKETTPTT